MTNRDFSNGFDTLLNSYAHSAAFGDDVSTQDIRVDEYEKSLFLTKSQEETVIGLYTGKNPFGESFEQTEELRRYLSDLVFEATLEKITNSWGMPISSNDKHAFYSLPDGSKEGEPAVWFIIYEAITTDDTDRCDSAGYMEVVPIRHDEYNKLRKNPFRGANDRRALRLDLSDNNVEIICKYKIGEYYLRYLKKPDPIVLIDLEADGMDINGEKHATPCKLHEALHQRILENAVIMALQSKGYTTKRE